MYEGNSDQSSSQFSESENDSNSCWMKKDTLQIDNSKICDANLAAHTPLRLALTKRKDLTDNAWATPDNPIPDDTVTEDSSRLDSENSSGLTSRESESFVKPLNTKPSDAFFPVDSNQMSINDAPSVFNEQESTKNTISEDIVLSNEKAATQSTSAKSDKVTFTVGPDQDDASNILEEEDSLSEVLVGNEDKTQKAKSAVKKRRNVSMNHLDTVDDSTQRPFTADRLIEYKWPAGQPNAEWYVLQEHVSQYLDVVSFKRKYPDLQRRATDVNERIFFIEQGIATEMQCDLGLTALKSDEVHELMMKDFPEKWEEYAKVLREREKQRVTEERRKSEVPKLDRNRMALYMKKAIKSTVEYNAMLAKEKQEERQCFFDLETMLVHYPASRTKKRILPPEATATSSYPVSLLPGQFQEYHKRYTPNELRYLPVNTTLYSPHKSLTAAGGAGFGQGRGRKSHSDDEDSNVEDGIVPLTYSTASVPSYQLPSSVAEENAALDASSSKHLDPPPTPGTPGSIHIDPSTPRSTGRPKRVVAGTSGPLCSVCHGDLSRNILGEAEDLVVCAECHKHAHPTCLELPQEIVPVIKSYSWQCIECKKCAKCMDPGNEEQMMFCDRCDRGYHTFCVGVKTIPTGRWDCPTCQSRPFDLPQPPSAKKKLKTSK